MRISIVMTTYNGEKYLLEQLDSLRTQTRTPDEVIICDDGSTDSTNRYIDKYITDHKGIANSFAGNHNIFCGIKERWSAETSLKRMPPDSPSKACTRPAPCRWP